MNARQPGVRVSGRQSLIFDADDTLWENNIYFLAAVDDFLDWLDHAELSHEAIRAILDDVERANRGPNGYGARAFARNLRQTFRHISPLGDDDPRGAEVERFGLRILEQTMEVLDGVEAALEALAPAHDLFLLTKGDEEEQRLKFERSGLDRFFAAAIVTHEKSPRTYREVVETFDLDAHATWMIGNSPRSDINPALVSGLNAVFIPHPQSWRLELEELIRPPSEDQTLLEVASIRDLAAIFAGAPDGE